jgi:hypothetical protein
MVKFTIFLFLSIFLPLNVAAATMQIHFVDKKVARYESPESALAAFFSAYMAGDLAWHFETLTAESAAEERSVFAENNIDPMAGIENFREGYVESYIDSKFSYVDSVVLVVRIKDVAGDISVLPYTLVQEDEKWKVTNKYSASEELLKYVGFEPKLFLGHGQRSADVNAFLAYHYPQEATTALPPGTSTFDLHVFYGATIDPSSFSARLDGQDLSGLFSPSPEDDQMVTLSLKPGRNVLLLSVEGKRSDGKTATDADRLVFDVP